MVEVGVPEAALGPARRRRRTPDEARAEILEAARQSIADDAVGGLSISAVMARTGLTRKAFYVHFRDRADLVEALVRPLRSDADAALLRWHDSGDPLTAGREALVGAAWTYREHSQMLRAIFWSGAEADAVRTRTLLVDPVVDVATVIINRIATGIHDARATAEALVTMNVYQLLRLRPETSDAELERLVDTLDQIWRRALLLHAD